MMVEYRRGWPWERTLADEMREHPLPPDPTPHIHFHEHAGVRHSHVHAHTDADGHAHSKRTDLAFHSMEG